MTVDDLFSPDDDDEHCEWDPINVACDYARHELPILSLLGKKAWRPEWYDLGHTDIHDVVDDFDEAIHKAGSPDGVRVGWPLGVPQQRGQHIALDVDDPEKIGPELQAVLDRGGFAVNPTSKPGKFHAIYRMPAGRTIGNSIAKFPERGWGQVRGFHGVIAIAGPDRPGFDVRELDGITEFPRPDWLTDAEDEGTPASDAEVAEFLATYVGNDALRKLETIVDRAADNDWRASRHIRAMDALAWAMRDARIGLFPARDAADRLVAQFLDAVRDDITRRKLYPNPEREVAKLVARAVGLANEMTDQDVLDRRWDAFEAGTIGAFFLSDSTDAGGEGAQPNADEAKQPSRLLLPRVRPPDPFVIPPIEWLIEGLWCEGTHGELAGGEKTLKSVLAMCIDVGLAAGVPVLGQFNVPAPRPVFHLAGEGGEAGYWRRLARVCDAYGISVDDVRPNLEVTFGTAAMTNPRFVAELEVALEEEQPALVHLDPYYAYGPRGVDSRQLTEVGAALEVVGGLCARHGSTLLINNHFNQTGSGNGLTRITGAGHAEWVDSWLLVQHREQPDVPGGRFRLHVQIGSRQWGGSSWDIDLNLGAYNELTQTHDGTMGWNVRPSSASAGPDAQAVHDDKIANAKLAMLRTARRRIKSWKKDELIAATAGAVAIKRAAFEQLLDAGELIEVGAVPVKSGRGSRQVPIYEVKK